MQDKTYRIKGYFADADLTDGIGQRGFRLEADGGTTIIAIQYVQEMEGDEEEVIDGNYNYN